MIYIVIPCFNEESRLDISYWSAIIEGVHRSDCFFCFVDDGSTDATKDLLQCLVEKYSVKLIILKQNIGKANAIRYGFELLSQSGKEGDLFGFIDCDMSFDAEEVINRILNSRLDIKHFQAIFMSRIKMSGTTIQRNSKRHILSRVIYTYLARGWEWAPYDTQCGFKFFLFSENFKTAMKQKFITNWFFDIELLVRLTKTQPNPLSIKEIPLNFWTERKGSKLRGQQIARIIIEIFQARRMISTILAP